jgi:hypothetical protein
MSPYLEALLVACIMHQPSNTGNENGDYYSTHLKIRRKAQTGLKLSWLALYIHSFVPGHPAVFSNFQPSSAYLRKGAGTINKVIISSSPPIDNLYTSTAIGA